MRHGGIGNCRQRLRRWPARTRSGRMKAEVAIVGGGPGGAALAMFLAREKIHTTIIESDGFPRYHVGESMTGECGAIVRSLGLGDYMAESKWPQKKGVKVY